MSSQLPTLWNVWISRQDVRCIPSHQVSGYCIKPPAESLRELVGRFLANTAICLSKHRAVSSGRSSNASPTVIGSPVESRRIRNGYHHSWTPPRTSALVVGAHRNRMALRLVVVVAYPADCRVCLDFGQERTLSASHRIPFTFSITIQSGSHKLGYPNQFSVHPVIRVLSVPSALV